ncbi:hypothetical protein Sango_0655000 [Sesamum angolense]|uniref:Uncharacterized protein n=1 Tax=Sesamum angolense TaxID=2727404 RepID=A0AAE1X760_9LAMI|nr:hypothetical protein Sango_0655000 [Sesamum angolense]
MTSVRPNSYNTVTIVVTIGMTFGQYKKVVTNHAFFLLCQPSSLSSRLQRSDSWALLHTLQRHSDRSRLSARDYNEILTQLEKEGCSLHPIWQMRNFHETLGDYYLHDLGFSGDQFTWSNRQELPNTISERLDRACGDIRWKALFPNASVEHLPSIYLDHVSIFISLTSKHVQQTNSGKGLPFEASWLQSEMSVVGC